MQRLSLLILIMFLPVRVQAAFTMPSDVLGAMRFGGLPWEYSAEAHNHYNGTFFSVWINGVQEGRGAWRKHRIDVTTHMVRENDVIRMKMRFLVHGDTLYFTVKEATLDTEDAIAIARLQTMLKKWVAMPLPEHFDDTDPFGFVDLIVVSGFDVLDIAGVWDQVTKDPNGTMTVEHAGYAAGNAYSLRPAVQKSNLNLHIKTNTQKDGSLTYGKYYVKSGTFVFQGNMEPHGSPVYLDVPASTISHGEFRLHVLGFEFPIPYGPAPEIVSNRKPQPVTVREEDFTVLPRPQPRIPANRNYVDFVKQGGVSQEKRTACAPAGTLDSVELGRKGICPNTRFYRRAIRKSNEARINGVDLWKQRITEERIVEGYDTIAAKFENFATRRDMHSAKTMLARATLSQMGSAAVDLWIKQEIIPFFIPSLRQWTVEHVLLTDASGNDGIALQRMLVTESGRRKNYVLFLLNIDKGKGAVVTDVFLNTRLRELREEGLIQ